MLTVSKLATSCGLSRTTVLYYESIGLLKPAARTAGNYRKYSDKDLERLRQIRAWREAGLTLEDIRILLGQPGSDAASVLKRRLLAINDEIDRLRSHQRAILKLLQAKQSTWRTKMISKEKWVSIMKASGFTEDQMHRWHAEFERMAPEDHREFLEYLHIPNDEIQSIRDASRKSQP